MLEGLLVSTLVPIVLDLVKSIGGAASRKFLGLSVDDQIKLDNAQVERLKALATLDNPYGEPDKWVVNLRGAFRYVAACGLILGGLMLAAFGASEGVTEYTTAGIELAVAPFGFIFGERLVLTLRGGAK
jgi:hypothetical protein